MARGESWSPSSSSAKDFATSYVDSKKDYGSGSSYQSNSYQSDSGSSYQNINTPSFKAQTEDFFSRKQNENSNRPE